MKKLYFYNGRHLTMTEIARENGIPPDTLRWRMNRSKSPLTIKDAVKEIKGGTKYKQVATVAA